MRWCSSPYRSADRAATAALVAPGKRAAARAPQLAPALAAALLAMVALGCESEPTAGQTTARPLSAGSGAIASTSTVADAGSAPILVTNDWRRAARMANWPRAIELLGALPATEQQAPPTRLALGYCALRAGRYATAVKALDGLGASLPQLSKPIARWYAEAAAVVGPHARAARWLARSAKVRDLLLASQAMRRAGELGRARALADKAVKRARRTRRKQDAARAHQLRAQLANEAHDVAMAAADWGWLVAHAGAAAAVHEAMAGLGRLGVRLTMSARLDALVRASSRSTLERTLQQLDGLADKHPAAAAQVALARARTLYRVRAFKRAAAAFKRASALPTGHAAEAHYLAARAAERADLTDSALEGFAAVTMRFAASGWAERSRFRRAELLLQLGRWAEAATAFTHYLSRHGRSKWAARAQQGRALGLLGAGRPARARAALNTLRQRTKERRLAASLAELEGLAALRAGDRAAATRLWLELLRAQPLTWPAIAARARLVEMGHHPLPPLLPASAEQAPPSLTVALPPAPRLLHSLGLEGPAEQLLAATEPQAAKGYPGRESEALCAMYAKLGRASRRYRVGQRAVSLDQLMHAPAAADRWTWSCVYPAPYADLTSYHRKRQHLPLRLLHAVMRQESAFNPEAVSPAGAVGLMQLMPATAKQTAGSLGLATDAAAIDRPDVNIAIGAHYLRLLLARFAGSLPLAIASYNAGPRAVERWLAHDTERQADLWVARIPYRETRQYVGRVLANLARYQWLDGGAAAVTPLALALPKTTELGHSPSLP